MKTTEVRVADLEAKVADLETALSGLMHALMPKTGSLEDQHRLKLVRRAAKGE